MTWSRKGAALVWTNCIIGNATLSHLAMGRSAEAPSHARAGAPMSPAQEAIWNNIYARVWSFIREVRTIDGGAKLSKAALDITELETLILKELRQRDCYCDADGISGALLGSEAPLTPLIADHVALPSRDGFFDPRDFLVDDDVRASYANPDTLLIGGDASGDPASHTVLRGSGLAYPSF